MSKRARIEELKGIIRRLNRTYMDEELLNACNLLDAIWSDEDAAFNFYTELERETLARSVA